MSSSSKFFPSYPILSHSSSFIFLLHPNNWVHFFFPSSPLPVPTYPHPFRRHSHRVPRPLAPSPSHAPHICRRAAPDVVPRPVTGRRRRSPTAPGDPCGLLKLVAWRSNRADDRRRMEEQPGGAAELPCTAEIRLLLPFPRRRLSLLRRCASSAPASPPAATAAYPCRGPADPSSSPSQRGGGRDERRDGASAEEGVAMAARRGGHGGASWGSPPLVLICW
jgi:hypothetical protein